VPAQRRQLPVSQLHGLPSGCPAVVTVTYLIVPLRGNAELGKPGFFA
jgi:hypothetical protein